MFHYKYGELVILFQGSFVTRHLIRQFVVDLLSVASVEVPVF